MAYYPSPMPYGMPPQGYALPQANMASWPFPQQPMQQPTMQPGSYMPPMQPGYYQPPMQPMAQQGYAQQPMQPAPVAPAPAPAAAPHPADPNAPIETDEAVQSARHDMQGYKYNQHTTFHTFKATLGASDGKRHDDKYVPPLKAPLPRVVSIFRDHAFKPKDGLPLALVAFFGIGICICGSQLKAGGDSGITATLLADGVMTELLLGVALFGVVFGSTWRTAEKIGLGGVFIAAFINLLCCLLAVLWATQPDVDANPNAAWAWVGMIFALIMAGCMIWTLVRVISWPPLGSGKSKEHKQ